MLTINIKNIPLQQNIYSERKDFFLKLSLQGDLK